MPLIDRAQSLLLIIDVQTRLMPAIEGGEAVVANARRLIDAAVLLGVPVLFTEQNAGGLGPTVPDLRPDLAGGAVAHKMTFDATRADGFLDRLPEGHAIVVAGCEAHVCVLQTVLGLRAAGRAVYAVRDALGSRHADSKEAALVRMAAHGAEVVTVEMVAFEWLATARHPRFRDIVRLVK